jgi:peptidyl-prolyl cis-trans isomerase A (cyclophilin A)
MSRVRWERPRTSDPNSATSQFYFNALDNPGFDPENNPPGFTVFGRVIRGLDIVQDILVVPTGDENGFSNVPVTPVTIDAVERVDK